MRVNGDQLWHVPAGLDPSVIPAHDPMGDALQRAAQSAAMQWENAAQTVTYRWESNLLSSNERNAIEAAMDNGEYWLATLLEREAKGRWVESQLRIEFLEELTWSTLGVDAFDPQTGLFYEILSGSIGNLDRHGLREGMTDTLYRFITF